MTIPPIDPSTIAGLGPIDVATPDLQSPSGTDTGGGFGSLLAQQIGKLSDLQESAAAASQSLVDGTATDPSSVVVAVEKAQLAMQLAGQIRTKGAEAITDIFHTQI